MSEITKYGGGSTEQSSNRVDDSKESLEMLTGQLEADTAYQLAHIKSLTNRVTANGG